MDRCECILGEYKDRRAILKSAEVAKILKIHPVTLNKLVNAKQLPGLPAIKIGKRRRFLLEDLLKFIESRVQTTTLDEGGKND